MNGLTSHIKNSVKKVDYISVFGNPDERLCLICYFMDTTKATDAKIRKNNVVYKNADYITFFHRAIASNDNGQ